MNKDRDYSKSESPGEKPVIEVDSYGIKARVTPSDPDTPTPRTWREVWHVVSVDLKRIIVEVSGTLVDSVRGARRMIRGVTGIPCAITARIEGAHVEADCKEQSAQRRLETGKIAPLSPEEAIVAVKRVLDGLQSKARVAHVRLPDGRVCLIAVARHCVVSDEEIASVVARVFKGAGARATVEPLESRLLLNADSVVGDVAMTLLSGLGELPGESESPPPKDQPPQSPDKTPPPSTEKSP